MPCLVVMMCSVIKLLSGEDNRRLLFVFRPDSCGIGQNSKKILQITLTFSECYHKLLRQVRSVTRMAELLLSGWHGIWTRNINALVWIRSRLVILLYVANLENIFLHIHATQDLTPWRELLFSFKLTKPRS